MRPPFLLLSLFLLTYAQVPSNGSCYFPDGTYTPDHHPCDPYAFISACCPTGWTCFSNQLCIITSPSTATTDDPVGTTIRGTCTNPDWNSTICGDFCLSGDRSGALTPCGDGRWCCSSDAASDGCDCTSGDGTFAVPSGQALDVIATIDSMYTVLTGTAVPTSTGTTVEPSSLATASSSSAPSSLSTSSASSTSSFLSTPTTLAPNKATAPPSSSLPSSIPSAAPITSPAAQSAPITAHPSPLTLGLSISFGLLALGLLAALIWYTLRGRRARALTHPNPDTYMGPHRHPSRPGPSNPLLSPPIGPPAPPAPVPHPYHTARNGAAQMEVPGRGLSQIRPDGGGLPLVDPYAAAARRADQGMGREGGTVAAGQA